MERVLLTGGMARAPRILQTDFPYHVTVRTNNREFQFQGKRFFRLLAQVLYEAAKKYQVQVNHVVLMSNHPHLILRTTEPNLHRFMQYVNGQVARRFNRATGRTGHLWGARYHATILETDEYYESCVRYVYRNPIRAKMVEKASEYEHSTFNFVAFGKRVEVSVVDDHLILKFGGDRQRLRKWLVGLVEGPCSCQAHTEEQIRQGLRRRFFGSPPFLQQVRQAFRPN